MGLSQAIVVYTRPPHLNFDDIEEMPPVEAYWGIGGGMDEIDWPWMKNSLEVNNSNTFYPLVT